MSARLPRLALAVGVLTGLACTSEASAARCDFAVVSYDMQYEIDAERRLFRSTQDVVVANISGESVERVCFLLHPDLVVDGIEMQEPGGGELARRGWEATGTREVFAATLQAVEVEAGRSIRPEEAVGLRIECHLRPEAVKSTPPPGQHPLGLVISPEASHAIGPQTGHNAVFGGEIAAPFRFVITHPAGQLCCAPGRLVSSERRGGTLVESFESVVSGIPTFSCASYEKTVRTRGGITVEYFLYPGPPFAEEMASTAFDVVQLYTTFFGPAGNDRYRFGNFAERESGRLWWENKGNAVYFTDLATRGYAENPLIRQMYAGLVAHELFHDWNLFHVSWSGKLAEWFGEAGANFVASWAAGRLRGEDFAAGGRAFFLEQYEQGRGYEAAQTLESVRKAGPAEQALIYYYGALVWEQLRQKIGDEALLAGLGDFFTKHRTRKVGYPDLLECLQARTGVPVEKYLSQWVEHNARIDLSIGKVSVEEGDGLYTTQVEVVVDADRDYELLTGVGFRASAEEPMTVVDLHLDGKGTHTVTLESRGRPVFIQVDPAFRVPQVNLGNNTWEGRTASGS